MFAHPGRCLRLYALEALLIFHYSLPPRPVDGVEQALKLKSNYPRVVLRKARIHKRLGHWAEAIKVKIKNEKRARNEW